MVAAAKESVFAAAAAAAADAAADHDSALLLQVEALLWELAPRARVVAALEAGPNGGQAPPAEAQQRLLLRALAAPPPHAPALLLRRPPASAEPPPPLPAGGAYLAGVLQRAAAGFLRGGASLDEGLAAMLQRALSPPPRTTRTAEEGHEEQEEPTTTAPLLKTWCYLPPELSALYLSALASLRAQAAARRRNGWSPADAPPPPPQTDPPAASAAAGLVSLRLSPDIFAAGTGATTWAAGFVLSEWLLSRRAAKFVKGRRVLELGSGAGLAGVCAWRAGARRLRLTDADEGALSNCGRNVFANLGDEGYFEGEEEKGKKEASAAGEGEAGDCGRRSLRLLRLQWDDAPRLPIDLDDPDDLVIAADVAYDPLILPGLTRALAALLRRRRRRRETGVGEEGGGGGSGDGSSSSRDESPFAVVATTVRQESTLALLVELATGQGLRMTEEAEWWRQRQGRRRQGGGGEQEESEEEENEAAAVAAAEAAAEGRAWGDDPRFVSVQGLDRRGIVVHVVDLVPEEEDAKG